MLVSEEFKEIVTDFETLKTLNPQEGQEHMPHGIDITHPDNSSQELSRRLDEMTAKYDQLNTRFKHIVEARDALSKQVLELRKKVDEYEGLNLNGTNESIRLLSKLVDEESYFRAEADRNNFLPPNYNPYDRHNQFVNLFLKLMIRGEK